MTSHLISQLNDAQKRAVTADSPHQLVLAGAGSGKTRVLVHRIAWLLENQLTSAYGIMAVTFTNKAAKEMRQRLEQLLQMPISGMWVGTFHSLAHRLLKIHWQEANLPQNFQILDSDDQLRLIKRLLKEHHIDDKKYPPKQIQWFINQHKDAGRRAGHVDVSNDEFQKKQQAVYALYEAQCQRSGLVDFAEILLRAHELWLNNPNILAHYQQRFRFVLVDEFQDTNDVQYAWIRLLVGEGVSLMAVGDDDQSIYAWRGANIANIQNFYQHFAHSEQIKLEQNYRSTQTILDAANALISHNHGRLGKNLYTSGEKGEKIQLYAAFNEQDEARYIADMVSQWHKKGRKRAEFAILYRSNAQSRSLEEALLRASIPYRIYGGQRFYERLEIKHALSYLRLMLNPYDDAALDRIINVPPRAIGEKTISLLRVYARDHGCSLWQACERAITHKLLTPRATQALAGFMTLRDEMSVDITEASLATLGERAIEQSGLLTFFEKDKDPKSAARIENLKELVAAMGDFNVEDAINLDPDSNEQNPLALFLTQASLDAGDTQAEEYQDAVQLMTLHSAKGLEFPQVVIAGLEETLFPHQMSMDDFDGLEEERRLAYVGITRAMENLTLTHAENRRLYAKEVFNAPSRFMREIPTGLIQEVRLNNSIRRPLTSKHRHKVVDTSMNLPYQLGQQVEHSLFGIGTVLQFEGSPDNLRVQIEFATSGTKWLVVSLAKLTPLNG